MRFLSKPFAVALFALVLASCEYYPGAQLNNVDAVGLTVRSVTERGGTKVSYFVPGHDKLDRDDTGPVIYLEVDDGLNKVVYKRESLDAARKISGGVEYWIIRRDSISRRVKGGLVTILADGRIVQE